MLQLSSVAGGQYASVVMAAKHLGQVRHFHSRIYERIVISHGSRNEFIELSSTKKNYYPPEKYYIPLDPHSRYLRSSSAHVRQKGARFRKAKRKRKAFPLSRKKILRTAPPSPPRNEQVSRNTTRYLTQGTSNLKTDAPTIRHTG